MTKREVSFLKYTACRCYCNSAMKNYMPPQMALNAASEVNPAVSVRNIRSPIDSASAPCEQAAFSSASVNPPSGPTITVAACGA